MPEIFDDAIVGAGIIGLAHAYHLARRRRRVVVFERNPRACGASVRNFGMLWPIGQPAGPLRDLAMRSLGHWRAVLSAAGLWHDPCGSLHLAHHDDEAQVLIEFANLNDAVGFPLTWMPPGEVMEMAPAVNRRGLRGGLFSPTEICVDPREVIARLPAYLAETLPVEFRFDHLVTGFDGTLVTARGRPVRADRLWVCSGEDIQTLYPELFAAAGLRRCKLQMMRTPPVADRLGPMLAGGLTLRHYPAFAACPSLRSVRERVARESPEFDLFGIHVMTSQQGTGEITIGDSHEYDLLDAEPFNRAGIDALILDYLQTFLDAPDLTIASRWQGVYLKHSTEPYLIVKPTERVTLINGVGGNGMTFSFGLAELVVGSVLGETKG